MPSLTCPNCGFRDAVLEDAAGPVSCPDCGATLAVKRERRRRKPPVPAPAEPEEADDAPPEQPRAVRDAGLLWILGGAAGLAADLTRGVAAWHTGPPDPDSAGPAVGLGAALLVFYAGLIGAGVGLWRGTFRSAQLAGWVVLAATLVLLAFNGGFALGAWAALAAADRLPAGVADWVRVHFFATLPLLLLGLFQVFGALMVLWHDADYHAWRRGHRPGGPERGALPAAAAFAGGVWVVLGGFLAGDLLFRVMWLKPQGLPVGPAYGLGVVGAAAAYLLVVSYFGLLVLHGRLTAIGPMSLVLLVVILLGQFAVFAATDADHTPALVWGVALALLGVLAAVAGLGGDAAYRRWLRAGRGGPAAVK